MIPRRFSSLRAAALSTALAAVAVAAPLPALAQQGDARSPGAGEEAPAKAEEAFAAMLTDATLNGTWAPIDKSLLGDDRKDGYHIVRATKKEGDQWILVSRMTFQGQEFEIPIPVTVKFAGDTAVMILNDLPLGDGTTWSARILFHDDVYAGSWWGANKEEKSGIVSGTITRTAGQKE